ncbi:MAG TPA: thermonuclease family protein [Anaerolineae bacterium]|nr:thermonuclease family protein [Anaerolineae bacterium]MCB0223783.1 thermonuclease family protein [Anaerolineae bacterium]MCB9102980.1 thermonuclease family protein [Anaerolineales bacterium]HRV93154.1 thermonuclease family protein [Anaerolineae bacterium]
MRNLTIFFGRWLGLSLLGGILFLGGCSSAGSSPQNRQSLSLPTREPTVAPSPSSTRVMPIEVLTPPPTGTTTPIPDEALGLVVEVLDGDTLAVVMDGDPPNLAYTVKLLGIEAPELTEPWGVVAFEANQRLANLKVVRLVRDETDYDDDGNLLRYVYIDNQMLNILLTEQGLVSAQIIEPNSRFESQIEAAQNRAQEGRLGIWSQTTPTPTVERATRPTQEATESTPAATEEPEETTTPASTQGTPTTTPTETPTEAATSEPTVEPTSES